ncbi:hypothetical protein DYB36_002788 [Aphanomyces astaci]|uniref:Uncharacterized protein n=1 Tax=Aphanomyces astaci TaxID=112090 RepID=A0A396ZYV9_APHAT|nr:hypothetical protein DYB36_002788 [Aphanomyces astaci]
MGVHEMLASAWADRRKRYLLTAAITLVALFAVVVTIVATVQSQGTATADSSAPVVDRIEGGTQGQVKAPSSGPTSEPPSTLSGEVATPSPAPHPSSNAAPSATSTTPKPTPPPNLVYTCSASDPTSVCYIPPTNSPLYCTLDKSFDPNLLYIAAPSAGNTNAGFAMEQPCASGDRCVYGCEPPYVASSNGWSNADCIPYISLCPPYSASTSQGGLYCDKGRLVLDSPNQPLCVPGLNTSFVTNYVPATMSTCQRVTPGNGAPMIGLEVSPGQTKQLAAFPQAYAKVPGYGVRVRNCNDVACGPVQCDASYVYNAATDTLDAYWVKYNAVFGSTAVGCVVGNGWSARDGMSKYTLYEYYPTTTGGQQTATCVGCPPASSFDATRCRKLRQPMPARFGSGVSPAQYVCIPVGAAVGLAGTLTVLSATSAEDDGHKNGWLTATVQIEIFVACVLAAVVVVAATRAHRIPGPVNSCAILEPQPVTELPMQWTPDRRGSMHASQATYVPRSSTTTFEPAAAVHEHD